MVLLHESRWKIFAVRPGKVGCAKPKNSSVLVGSLSLRTEMVGTLGIFECGLAPMVLKNSD